jgi:transposase-like protein
VAQGATVMTDELASYNKIASFGFSHGTVNHGIGQYVDGLAHVQGMENFWKHFKKGIEAIYIHVSPKHLQKYCDEFAYRFNQRDLNDSGKFTEWFRYCEKRLTYKELIV